jgi:hypothetical protein
MKIQITLLVNSLKEQEKTLLSIRTDTGIISSFLVNTYTRLISAPITSTFVDGRSAASTIVEGSWRVVGRGFGVLRSNA